MRDFIIEKLYELSMIPYQKFLKKTKPWNINQEELLKFKEGTLGFHLSCFLAKHHFEIQPKLESHDVFHVLTGTGVTVQEEIGMQYYLFGNGKRSLYLFMVSSIGALFYPDQINYFIKRYKEGKETQPFHHLDYSQLLSTPLKTLKETFSIN
jgi:Coenzyme Q (ubiquinone) biosynthesis protein Coq4